MRKDFIQEMQYGEGAIKVPAKFMLFGRGDKGCIILGGLFENLLEYYEGRGIDPLANLEKSVEMWAGHIILIPGYKFRQSEDEDFIGLSFEQIMASDWGDPKRWKEVLFKKSKQV